MVVLVCISHCFAVCDEMEFRCEGSGLCIHEYYICDGYSHCSDSSDENTPECGETMKQ